MGQKTVTIIGAGPLGLASAQMLAENGYNVVLIEKDTDILFRGKGPPANIIHKDGLEYYNADDPTTGWHCVDGAIALATYYGHSIETLVSHFGHRTHFYLSKESEARITISDFLRNADLMRQRYKQKFAYIRQAFGLSDVSTAFFLHGLPEDSILTLSPEEMVADNVACGVAGSATGLNMPNFYNLWKSRLGEYESKIKLVSGVQTQRIRKERDGTRTVVLNNDTEVKSDFVVIAAGYATPYLTYRTDDAINGPEGDYLLNCMAKLDLPSLTKPKNSRNSAEAVKNKQDLSSIYFTLQGPEAGASFVCHEAPDFGKPGRAVSYVPNLRGTQIKEYPFKFSAHTEPPPYEYYVKKINKPKDIKKRRPYILDRLHHYHPFLRKYLALEHINFDYGVVFTSQGAGALRRIRPVEPVIDVTGDGRVIAAHASKFTMHVLHALEILQHVLKIDKQINLPTSKDCGFGLGNFDLVKALGPKLMIDPGDTILEAITRQGGAARAQRGNLHPGR